MTIVAIILTRNEERHIRDCIGSVAWMDNIIVFDSGSSDQTCQIARDAGAEVKENDFHNYAQQRNDALAAVSADWVFFLDADERCTPQLRSEIEKVIAAPAHSGYYVPRHNYIFGKLTLYSGWYPDHQMRLLKHGEAHYDPEIPVHEVVILASGERGYLNTPLVHYNYDTIEQFHEKQQRYTVLDAQTLYDQGIRPRFYTPYLQPLRHFKWRFLDLEGYRDGLHGLRLCLLMSWYEYLKFRRLIHLLGESDRQ